MLSNILGDRDIVVTIKYTLCLMVPTFRGLLETDHQILWYNFYVSSCLDYKNPTANQLYNLGQIASVYSPIT